MSLCVCSLQPVRDPRLLDAAVLVHSRPLFEGSLDPSAREVNLMFHMWAFQGERGSQAREGEGKGWRERGRDGGREGMY